MDAGLTDSKRKIVSYDQLNAMLDFLREHQELARGLCRGRRGRMISVKLWNQCAKKLNVIKDGAPRDGKSWSRYWCDWKYRVRRRALELKATKDNNKTTTDITPLSPMEENIMSIIGEHTVDGVVIKSDPLADQDTDEEEPENESNDNNESMLLMNQYFDAPVKPRKAKKRRHSSREVSDDDPGGPSSPSDLRPSLNAVNNAVEESDHEDVTEFLQLEREKIENSKKVQESMHTIASEIRRLTDVMTHIRDVLINNRINI